MVFFLSFISCNETILQYIFFVRQIVCWRFFLHSHRGYSPSSSRSHGIFGSYVWQGDSEYFCSCLHVTLLAEQSRLVTNSVWTAWNMNKGCRVQCNMSIIQTALFVHNELYCRLSSFSSFHTAFASALMGSADTDNHGYLHTYFVRAAMVSCMASYLHEVLPTRARYTYVLATSVAVCCFQLNHSEQCPHSRGGTLECIWEEMHCSWLRMGCNWGDFDALMPWLKSADQFNGSMVVWHSWHGL